MTLLLQKNPTELMWCPESRGGPEQRLPCRAALSQVRKQTGRMTEADREWQSILGTDLMTKDSPTEMWDITAGKTTETESEGLGANTSPPPRHVTDTL